MSVLDNEITKFLRSDHFTASNDFSKKTILEMAVTRALADTTVAGAGQSWLVYIPANKTVSLVDVSASLLRSQGYELDHVIERQFISALFFVEIGDYVPPLDILNDLISLANLSANLVWIPKALHAAKSNYFSATKSPLTEEVRDYLQACQVVYQPGLDQFNTDDSYNGVKEVVKAIKFTPWYQGDWHLLNGEHWFNLKADGDE